MNRSPEPRPILPASSTGGAADQAGPHAVLGPRARRALRAAGMITAAAAVLVLALSLVVRAHAAQSWEEALATAESELGPLDLAAYLRPAVPVGDNVAPIFVDASRRSLPGDMETLHAMRALAFEPRESWPPAAAAEALIQDYEPAIAELHRAGAGAFGLGLDYRLGWRARSPNLIAYNLTGRLLLAHGRWSLARGEEAAALASARALAVAAGGLEREPPLVAKFFGSIAESRLHRLVADALVEGAGADTLAELRDLIGSLPQPIGLREALAYDAAAMVLEMDRWVGGGIARPRGELCAGEVIDRYAGLTRLPDRELVEAVRAARTIETGQPEPVRNLRQYSDRGSWWGTLCLLGSDFELPYLGMEYEALHLRATESARRLADAALALGLHAHATGAYPPTLDAVTPGVPAPLTGEPLDYRLLPGGGASLAYPRAAAAVEELSSFLRRDRPVLAWELPPPR